MSSVVSEGRACQPRCRHGGADMECYWPVMRAVPRHLYKMP